jgi:hypothetical protein
MTNENKKVKIDLYTQNRVEWENMAITKGMRHKQGREKKIKKQKIGIIVGETIAKK